MWSYYSKHWDCGPISVSTGIIILSLKLLPFFVALFLYALRPSSAIIELWPYPSTHSNSGLIFIHIGTLILSFQTLGFWPYFYTHWNFDLILRNKGILALSLHTLYFKFWSYRSNVGIMVLFVNIGFLILSFKKTLGLWPCFFKHWNYDVILANIGFLAVFLSEFWSYSSKHWNTDLNLPNNTIRP